MNSEVEWIVTRLQGMTATEIYQWLGDEINLESKGAGAAPLKREDAAELGTKATKGQDEKLERCGYLEHLRSLEGRLSAAAMVSSVATALNQLPKYGVAIPYAESAAFLTLVTSIYLVVLNAQSVNQGANKPKE